MTVSGNSKMATIKTDELDQWQEHGIYKTARLMECMGDIDEEKAKQVIKNIRLLDFISDKDIVILLATTGGEVCWGMEIVDAIKECNSKVTIHAVGPCWSMGAIIFQAGDYRKISKNATIMIHTGTSEYPEDHALNMERWIAEDKRIGGVADQILFDKLKKKNIKLTKKQFDRLLEFDTIYTAEAALENGLADEIAQHREF